MPLKYSFVEGKSKKDGGLTDTPLVFLHSLLGSGAMFKNYATALEVSAYLPDLRNHGLSRPYIDSMEYVDMAHDVREMLDAAGIEKAVFVGHSLGGKVAMTIAQLFPDCVVGLCSMDQPPINRNAFPELNNVTRHMLIEAKELSDRFSSMTFDEAFQMLLEEFKNPEKIQVNAQSPYRLLYMGSFLLNLDRSDRRKARLLMSMEHLAQEKCMQ